MGHWTYLAIILIPGLPTLLATVVYGRKILSKYRKTIGASIIFLTLYCAAADLVAISVLQIWSFREELVTGIRFFGLYIEEWILFLVTQSLLVCWTLIVKDRLRAK